MAHSITPRKINHVRLEAPLAPQLQSIWSNYPPPGLLYISAYLKQHGYNCGFDVEEKDADIYFLSSVSQCFSETARRAVDIVNRRKDVFVVIGGAHITFRPEDLPQFERIIGVIGEGEKTALELLDAIQTDQRPISAIKGVCFWTRKDENNNTGPGVPLALIINEPRKEIKDLDEIPPPDYSILPEGVRHIPLVTSRGCPYKCKFCSSQARWDSYRKHSADWVIKAVEQVVSSRAVDCVELYDDLFVSDLERLEKIIEGVKHLSEPSQRLRRVTRPDPLGVIQEFDEEFEFPGVHFQMTARANLFTREAAEIISRLNRKSVSFGFESGSDKVLKNLKGPSASVKANKEAADLCDFYDIPFSFSLIAGAENETEEDLQGTQDLIDHCRQQSFEVYPLTVLPGSEYWNDKNAPLDWGDLSIENSSEVPLIFGDEITRKFLDRYPGKRATDLVNVIMPVWITEERNYRVWEICTDRLFKNTSYPFQLTLVNNASTYAPAIAKLKELEKQAGIKIITHKENKGFAGGCNSGFDLTFRYSLIFNSDVMVSDPTWLAKLVETAKSLPGAGIISPLTDVIDSPVLRAVKADGVTYTHNLKSPAVLWLVKRQCWQEIGGFDEKFWPGLFEDDDFLDRARMAGWKVARDGRVWVKHIGGRSQSQRSAAERASLLKKNKRLLDSKRGAWKGQGWSFNPIWNSEIAALEPYMIGDGIDLCCGNRKTRKDLIGIDRLKKSAADVIGDASKLDYIGENFDFATAVHSIEHFEDTEAVLTEWMRILKPGGYLCLIVPDDRRDQKNRPKDHCHEFTPTPFKRLVSKFGEVVQHDTLFNSRWSFDSVIRKAK